ncbi:MAG: hypothetical protein ACREEM_25555 [Blastocatellia bacterium]
MRPFLHRGGAEVRRGFAEKIERKNIFLLNFLCVNSAKSLRLCGEKKLLSVRTHMKAAITDFTRNTKATIGRLKKSGKPLVLTVNGKAEVIVQDAGAYQKMLDLLGRLEAIEGIRRGLESMREGRGVPLEQFKQEVETKYGISPKRTKKK